MVKKQHISKNDVELDPLWVQDFDKKLRSWYLLNHRSLPWRETTDPYKIWLSEIILQQTRVAQGMPYYERFVSTYPTVFDLAAAEEQEVLRLWQGLGYYSRARNMHFTAKQVVNDWSGVFPNKATELSKLKGLGHYTAAAIASFAFGDIVPAIDGNVYRVLARLFGIDADILSSTGKQEFLSIATQLISREDPGIYNQAMIEFGALQCVPVAPKCGNCPFANSCYAYANDAQSRLPVKSKKVAVRNRYLHYFIIETSAGIAMKLRYEKDIWKGLYDFPLIENESMEEDLESLLYDGFVGKIVELGVVRRLPKTYTHQLTHQKLNVTFWWIKVPEKAANNIPAELKFYSAEQVHDLPKPILVDIVLKDENYI